MNRSTLLPLSCTLLSLAMVASGFAASLVGTDVRPHHLLTGRVGMVTAGSAAGTEELGRALTGIAVTGQVSSESNTTPIQALRAEVVSRWDSSFRILVTVATFFVGLAGIAVPVLVWIFGRRLLDEFRQQAKDASSEAKAAREAAKSAATEAKAATEAAKNTSAEAKTAGEVATAAAADAKAAEEAVSAASAKAKAASEAASSASSDAKAAGEVATAAATDAKTARQAVKAASAEAKAASGAATTAANEAKAAGEAVKRSNTDANKALEKVEQAAAATAQSKQDAAEALKVARSAVKDATANKAKLGEVEAKQKAHLEEIRASLKKTLRRLNPDSTGTSNES